MIGDRGGSRSSTPNPAALEARAEPGQAQLPWPSSRYGGPAVRGDVHQQADAGSRDREHRRADPDVAATPSPQHRLARPSARRTSSAATGGRRRRPARRAGCSSAERGRLGVVGPSARTKRPVGAARPRPPAAPAAELAQSRRRTASAGAARGSWSAEPQRRRAGRRVARGHGAWRALAAPLRPALAAAPAAGDERRSPPATSSARPRAEAADDPGARQAEPARDVRSGQRRTAQQARAASRRRMEEGRPGGGPGRSRRRSARPAAAPVPASSWATVSERPRRGGHRERVQHPGDVATLAAQAQSK